MYHMTQLRPYIYMYITYIDKQYLSESMVKPVLAFQDVDLDETLPSKSSKYMFLNLLPTSIFQQNLLNHPTTKNPQPQ